jgi:type IV pilus assembly protein PilA
MRKFIQQKLKDQKGLTLIELLAVIVILAIIAAIAIPAIGNIIENSRNGAAKSDYQNVLAASNIYFTENPNGMEVAGTPITYTNNVTVAELIAKDYLDDAGTITSGTITKGTGGASNSIYGENKEAKYNIADPGLTNALLSSIPNKDFNAAGITAKIPD